MLVGLDVLRRNRADSARSRLSESKVALLTHGAAVDSQGTAAWEVLRGLGIDVEVVFSPEHGLDGVAEAEEPVGTDDANIGGTRLVSLYGSDKVSLSPRSDQLTGLDVLVIDLCDVGSRYYTYVWTALLAARAACDAGVHTMILDRPNPLGSCIDSLEGRTQDRELCSFVGLEPVPVRHGLTLGEMITSLFNQEDRALGRDGALSVVPTEGWERQRLADAWGRPFIPPSPNMPSLQTALVYPGACLLEGTNLSEGRGTTTPFQTLGAPFLDGSELVKEVGDIPGAWLRPTRFKPHFGKHAGRLCGGLMLHVTSAPLFRPLATYLKIIFAARKLAPEEFGLIDRVYEFETDHSAFELLTGTPQASRILAEGTLEELVGLLCPVDEDWAVRVEFAEDLVSEVRA